VVEFQADPAVPSGTRVGLKIGAAGGVGRVTACDCPEQDVDTWVQYLTIE
jgi:hypothetical protein